MVGVEKQQSVSERHELSAKDFTIHVRDAEKTSQSEYINALRDKIEKQGIILSQNTDLCELQRYRSMISEFLSAAVRGAYSFEKNNFFDSGGGHQILSEVKKINSKLDELAEEVLAKEKDNLKITNLVEDIRGLVFDITV